MMGGAAFVFDRTAGLSPNLVWQMLAELPAGKLVDHVATDLLLSSPGGTLWLPTPSEVSAKVLRDTRDQSSPEVRAAIIAGATNPDTITEISNEDNLSASDQLALICNTNLHLTHATVRIPNPNWIPSTVTSTCALSAMSALLDGKITVPQEREDFLTQIKRILKVVTTGSDPEPWRSDPRLHILFSINCVPAEFPVCWEWDSMNERQQASIRTVLGDHLGRREQWERYSPSIAIRGEQLVGGLCQDSDWLPAVLFGDSVPAWQSVVKSQGKPVAGRHIGKRLYSVTGDNPGLWTAAVAMLEDWEGSLPEWLDTVAAL